MRWSSAHANPSAGVAKFEAALSMQGIEVHASPAVKHRNDTQAEPTSPLDASRSKSQGMCR